MRTLFAAFTILLVTATAAVASPSSAAKAAAAKWLGLVDNGNYAQSWITASPLLKTRTSEAQWAKAAGAVLNSLGALDSREMTTIEMRSPSSRIWRDSG